MKKEKRNKLLAVFLVMVMAILLLSVTPHQQA